MDLIYRLKASGDGEVSRPAPEKLVSGDPVFTTWNVEDMDGLYAGIWQSTAGRWRISYDEWEYCHILEKWGDYRNTATSWKDTRSSTAKKAAAWR